MCLTAKEQCALDAIRELAKTGFSPTIDQVKAAIGSRSSRAIQELIGWIRSKGFLLKWPGRRQNAILLASERAKERGLEMKTPRREGEANVCVSVLRQPGSLAQGE